MKAEFLKLAGVKSEKAFYKKYPTEQAFFKAHPEAKKMIKKAQAGTVMSGMSSYLQGMQGVQNMPNMQNVIQGQTQSGGVNAGMFNGPQVDNSVSTINASQLANNQSGYAYPGGPNSNVEKGNSSGITKGLESLPGLGGDLMKGYNNLRAERRAKKEAQMWAKVTGVQAKASESTDIDSYRQYTDNMQRKRNAFMPEMTGEEFFPVHGVGTNVLARNGARLEDGGMVGGNPTEIQNTYGDGNSLYDNLEYEPLYDVDQVKSYRMGGYLPKAQVGAGVLSGASETMGGAAAGSRGIMGGASQTMGTSSTTPWGAIGQVGSGVANGATGNNAGGQIGGSVGGAVGSIFGPAGQAIGQIGGSLIGGLLDTNPRDMRKAQSKIKYNTDRMIKSQFGKANQSYLSSMGVAEDGINMNPQVITRFGDLDAQDFADYAHEDQLRSGGHLKSYTPPSARAMQTYENGGGVKSYGLGGELQTHWGGGAETMSYNPYLPGSGETVMFRGKSHEEYSPNGETGIGVTYGGNPVEVERGEPMVELEDGGAIDPQTGEPQKSGVVFGNLKIPDQYIDLLGDKNAKGKKFKNYIADLSKTEEKQNKMIEKSTNELNALDVNSSFDRLKLSSLQANIKGSNLKLKEIADKKIKAADLQNAINETAEEYGLVADDLARGKVKIDKTAMKEQAKFGASIPKAQVGEKVIKGRGDRWSYTKAGDTGNPMWDDAKRYEQEWAPSVRTALADKERAKKMLDYINNSYGAESDKVKKSLNKFSTDEEKINFLITQGTNKEVGPIHHVIDAAIKYTTPGMTTPLKEEAKVEDKVDNQFETVPYKRSGLLDAFGQLLPYIRPTDQEELDPNQLLGEMYAMSNNNLEPVQAQSYNPQLRVPYDISYQDRLNEINAGKRATQRMVGYNPAAQANIAAQAYGAESNVLAEQFRANQAMKDQVYSGNIATLNDAKLKNLSIYDQQYTRQEQAKSNTKATSQAVLNSISDKYAKNKLENRTLGIYENLYNYRYDNAGRAINMNAPWQPNIPYIYGPNGEITHRKVYDKDGKTILGYEPVGKTTKIPSGATPPIVPEENVDSESYSPINENDIMYQQRNGGKTKKKKYSQSSIVRAFK
jgi:hypothetical protein